MAEGVSSRFCRRSLLLPSLCIGVVVGAILLFVLLYLFVWRDDGNFFTEAICRVDACPKSATPLVDRGRAIGNKVDLSFNGYVDVWASKGADVFTSDMLVEAGQAWPRMYQGATEPLTGDNITPGFPMPVTKLTEEKAVQRYVSYNASWRTRRNGPEGSSTTEVSGKIYNGCYIWLNDRKNETQWFEYPRPRWPFGVEVNVWHRYAGTGHRAGATRFPDYYDNMGKYGVFGHWTQHDGDSFYAYYIVLDREKETSNFELNLNALFVHLMTKTGDSNSTTNAAITNRHEIIEVAVAAEGRDNADGQFKAYIYTLGRTKEEREQDDD